MISNKQKKLILYILLAIILFITMMPVTANAEIIKCLMCGENHNMQDLGSGWKFVYDWCATVYGDGSIAGVATSEILGFNTQGTAFSSLWSNVEVIYSSVKTVGLMLVVIYLTTEMYDLYAEDKLTAESLTRAFMRFVISVIIINNGFEIMEVFVDFANAIFARLSEGVSDAMASNNCNFARVQSSDLLGKIGEMFGILIPYVTTAIAMMIVEFFCFIRLFDIIVKTLFAPIGMADLGFKGTNGTGWRYLKGLMAAVLQGGVMLATIYVQSILSANGNWIQTIILYLAMISVFLKASSFARDVVGT